MKKIHSYDIEAWSIYYHERYYFSEKEIDDPYTDKQLKLVEKMLGRVQYMVSEKHSPYVTSLSDKEYFENQLAFYQKTIEQLTKDRRYPAYNFFIQGNAAFKYEKAENGYIIEQDDSEFVLFFTFKLRNIPLVEIKQFLDYHQQKHNGDFFHFLKTVLIQYPELIDEKTEEQIRNSIDILKNANSSKKLKPASQNVDSRKISINRTVIEQLHSILIPYFSEEDGDKLLLVLEGKEIDSKLNFNGSANKLSYVFQELKKHYFVNNSVAHINRWIVASFTYKNRNLKDYTPFNIEYLKKTFQKSKQISKVNRINLKPIFDQKEHKK